MRTSSFPIVASFGALIVLLHSTYSATQAFTSQHYYEYNGVNNSKGRSSNKSITQRFGWFDNLIPQANDAQADEERRRQFPEQYPATYEMSSVQVSTDSKDAALLRPLLKQTQLESRPLQLAYDASKHGWSAQAFHKRVDGKGAAIVIAKTTDDLSVGGYNPKGWASMGGARPSVAAFVFYKKTSNSGSNDNDFQKLQKVAGGGLACAQDDPNFGISFGPDALVIPLQSSTGGRDGHQRSASSKLGPYYERGPQDRSTLFDNSVGSDPQSVRLDSLKVFVGKYKRGEEIPYSGAVMDMTSG